jgi:hypothetical protein
MNEKVSIHSDNYSLMCFFLSVSALNSVHLSVTFSALLKSFRTFYFPYTSMLCLHFVSVAQQPNMTLPSFTSLISLTFNHS